MKIGAASCPGVPLATPRPKKVATRSTTTTTSRCQATAKFTPLSKIWRSGDRVFYEGSDAAKAVGGDDFVASLLQTEDLTGGGKKQLRLRSRSRNLPRTRDGRSRWCVGRLPRPVPEVPVREHQFRSTVQPGGY